ncbi:MAG: TIGR00730 family Rossman fold protein [Alphaproteobacteria bacterium]
MVNHADKDRIFPSADEDVEAARQVVETVQTRSPAYRLAFHDHEFLVRDELRPVRLQLELLKPELALQEENVVSTIVVFGSARTPDPEEARRGLAAAEEKLREAGESPEAASDTERARRVLERSRYYAEARRFAAIASRAGQCGSERCYVVVTGGGPGIMEAANRGAHDVGAESIGLNIVLPFEQAPNPYITPKLCFQFHYFAIRKMHFLMRARALVCFPGGFGTMDELFEALTLIQTGKIEPIPVLLFGESWWRRIVDFEAMVDEGVISPDDLGIFQYVDTAEAAWSVIEAFYAGPRPPRRTAHR